jgi:pimeloyl-ACP methyl ester carboxylesterase
MSPRRRLVVVLAAVLAAVLVAVTVLAVRRSADGPAVDQTARGPVLLLPGYGGSTTSLEVLAGALRAAGRDVEVVAAVGDGTGDLAQQAERLGAVVDARLAAGAPSVDVVGYSAGGVVARLWAVDDGGAAKARRVVTLGSPHHGTRVAGLAVAFGGDCPAACRQLAPGSDLLSGLQETRRGPVWTSVWTNADEVVTPPSSARLDGAVNVPVQSVCADATTAHGDLPRDPLVVGLVDLALDGAPLAQEPTAADCAVLRQRGGDLLG